MHFIANVSCCAKLVTSSITSKDSKHVGLKVTQTSSVLLNLNSQGFSHAPFSCIVQEKQGMKNLV
jgi:hypothetical protein